MKRLPLTTLVASALMTLALGSVAPAFSEQAAAIAPQADTSPPQVALPMVAPAVNPMIKITNIVALLLLAALAAG